MKPQNMPLRPSAGPLGGPLVIGLCGGIASGKSAVAELFEAAGCLWIDADRIARQVAEDAAVLELIRKRFGDRVIGPDGALDRAALASEVFEDARARRDLERITHPRIRERIEDLLAAGEAARRCILLDVPLLHEAGYADRCDEIVFVDTSDSVRERRARSRGWADGELARREAAQLPLTVKRSHSTAILSNDGSLESTERRVRELLTRWTAERGA